MHGDAKDSGGVSGIRFAMASAEMSVDHEYPLIEVCG
jgi:hypothetical protein